LLDIRSFQKVTGPKIDIWLVKTVGALVGVIGGLIGYAGIKRRDTRETRALGALSAATLAAIDIVYVAKGKISRVYLLDAAAELALVGAWLLVPRR
jgi:hypothetical protein